MTTSPQAVTVKVVGMFPSMIQRGMGDKAVDANPGRVQTANTILTDRLLLQIPAAQVSDVLDTIPSFAGGIVLTGEKAAMLHPSLRERLCGPLLIDRRCYAGGKSRREQ
ncbi:hypothetical protein HCN51_54985 [Nonomuraea sp. FMUSA5-5]|uniref:Uncharacterized protein n=1 Tax=Nonomuraea composti TaxID=2720023 RepID=A0ABX1BT00_9ACTN|nr:hypothetical protein [Nonomuraea sp. FMUSA5-5]NJP98436.1 hypothetical protein [Nonomuraea sp. FMUSA5-5]